MSSPPAPKGKALSPATSPQIRTKVHRAVVPQAAHQQRRLVDYESLLRLFECPSCRDWMTPPIAQCRKGHVICSSCRSSRSVKACPTCKQRFSEVPNLMMEQIAAAMAFPCRFQPHGCHEFNFLSAKLSHEAFCSFRPVPCQYASRGCSQVQQFYLMEQHVEHCAYRISALNIGQ